ncbi:MAG: transposase [Solibacteraceae bacterium]|nr:transposase [Solibacteraceae bacterium]
MPHYSCTPRPRAWFSQASPTTSPNAVTTAKPYTSAPKTTASDLQLLKDDSRHHGVAILGYCLMPNHVHLIAVPQQKDSFARTFRRVHAEYARAVHMRLRRVGHLWQARYGSAPMDEKHFWAVMLYVEQNPVRARLTEHAEQWKWSSAQARVKGADAGLLDLVPWRARHTPESWKLYLDKGLRDAAFIERIRDATQRGQPLGDEAFVKWAREQSEPQIAQIPRRSRVSLTSPTAPAPNSLAATLPSSLPATPVANPHPAHPNAPDSKEPALPSKSTL